VNRNNSTSGHPNIEAKQVADLPRPVSLIPPRHLTLVVDRDRQIDPVPTLAAIGPSPDF
jgi:hypothetical protein